MKRLILALVLAFALPVTAHAASNAHERAAVQKMSDNTLARLYKAQPDAQRDIRDAVGYAVFSNGSLAVIYFSGGYGHGLAHDNRSGRDTYMKTASGGVGLGLGVKDYSTVFVFHNAKAFHDFKTTGLDMSGHVDAAAKEGAKGHAYTGAADVLPGVRVYQMTKTGLMAQVMLQGTKYWKDKDLNSNDTSDATTHSHYNN